MPGSKRAWDEVRARVDGLGRLHARVGVIGAAASQPHAAGDLTNGEIATLHEFGNPSTGLPERSFVRATMRDPARLEELRRLQERVIGAVVAGRMTGAQAVGLLGAWAAGAIRAQITERGDFAPLAPATVAAKGSSKPLVDSGQLVGAISFEVVP